MLSKNIINKFLFISIILLAIIAGWAVSELFNKDSTSPSNNILLNFEAVDHMGNNVSTSVSYTHLRAHETPEHRGWRRVR